MKILVPNLQPNTDYALQLRANDGEAVSEWGSIIPVTTIGDDSVPQTPTGATWVVSGSSFYATWNPVTTNVDSSPANDLAGYRVALDNGTITRYINVGFNTEFDFPIEVNRNTFGDPAATVTFKVAAVDFSGNISAYTSPITESNPAPTPPSGLNATGGPEMVTLSWTASPDDDLVGYNIYVGATSGFTPGPGNKIGSTPSTSFVFPTITLTEQWFKVAAYDVFGTESTYISDNATAESPFTVDTDPPATPTGLSATITQPADGSSASMLVSWTANAESDLADYVVQYRPTGSTPWQQVVVSGEETSTTITGLAAYTNYDVRIQARDFIANASTFTSIYSASGGTNTAPSQPAAPTLASNTMQVQVTISGDKAAGGAMESDVDHYRVYLGTSSGFTANASTQVGVIPVGPVLVATFQVPASTTDTTWYGKVIAVDKLGLASSVSPASSSSTPTLIQAINITDATITSAKIASLEANKITAGSGLVNDLTVKSILTLGDASTEGVIRSYDYANTSGASGFYMDKNELIIKSGIVEAAAINLQSGSNMMHPAFAGFEYNPAYYATSWPVFPATSIAVTLDATKSKFNTSSLKIVNTAGAARGVYFGLSLVDYNITVEPSTRYIISMYIYNDSGATVSARGFLKQQDSASVAPSNQTIANTAAWVRYTFVVTTTSAATAALAAIEMAGNGTFYIDGVQVEKAVNNQVTTASAYAHPGSTRIDGAIIRTGEIRSTSEAVDAEGVTMTGVPAWSLDTQGDLQVGNALVRGSIVIGQSGETQLSKIQSYNFIPTGDDTEGTGWQILSDGTAELNSLKSIDISAIRNLTSENFESTLVLSTVITTGEPLNRRVELSPEGVKLYGDPVLDVDGEPVSEGDVLVHINAQPGGTSRFEGDIVADSITALGGVVMSSSGNTLTSGSVLTVLDASTKPYASTVMTNTWDEELIGPGTSYISSHRGLEYHSGSYYFLFSFFFNNIIKKSTWDGSKWVITDVHSYDSNGDAVMFHREGIARTTHATRPWITIRANNDFTWRFQGYSDDFSAGTYYSSNDWYPSHTFDGAPRICSITGSEDVWIVHKRTDNNKLRCRRVNPYTGTIVDQFDTATNFPGRPTGVAYLTSSESASIGLASAARLIVTTDNGKTVRHFNSTGAHQSTENFTSAHANYQNVRGIVFNDSLSRLESWDDRSEKLFRYTNNFWTDPALDKWYFTHIWRYNNGVGDTHNSDFGPILTAFPLKRAQIKLSTALPPALGITPEPNAVGFFYKRGGTAPSTPFSTPVFGGDDWTDMPAIGVTEQTAETFSHSGSFTVLTAFPTTTYGKIVTAAGGTELRGDGTLRVGTGGSVMKVVKADSGSYSFDASGEATVTHGLGFTPIAVIPNNGNANFRIQAFGLTSTTFTLRIRNASDNSIPAAASRACEWIAVVV